MAKAKKNILTQSRKKKVTELVQTSQFTEAKQLLEEVCRIDRMDAEAWFMLGVVNGRLNDIENSIACLSQSLKLDSGNALAHYNLGTALRSEGRLDEAIKTFQESVRLAPEFMHAHAALGDSLFSEGRMEEAVVCFRNMVRLDPSEFESHERLGRALYSLGNLEEAAACCRRVLQLRPDWAAAHDNLGNILRAQGLIDESIASHRRAMEIMPNDAWAYSNYLLSMQYLAEPDSEEIFSEHRRWADKHERIPVPQVWNIVRNPERRLKVGYVSADFRTHSIPFFFEPLLVNHDRSVIEPFCYSAVSIPDAVTARLQSMTSEWRSLIGMTGTQVAEMIRADDIDILIDLAGHTGNNALKVFTHKPAPVQATYLGYPDTTGLSMIDYRLTDALSDPAGGEAFYTESLVRLPGCFLCYQPLENAPEVAPLPALDNGCMTFGSFNHLPKVNAKVIALWAEVLSTVPNSRLLIKSLSLTDDATRERYYHLFEAQGVDHGRVDLVGRMVTQAEHLDLYNRIDIALDTFPYNGTTTTCEALWMGVPVVTLKGVRHSGRVGLSLLNAAGMKDWVAETPQQYVAIAAEMAGNPRCLAELRAGLRARIATSPLCDGKTFARKVEAAYREMWRVWCARGS